MSKRNAKKQIALSTKNRQKVAPMIAAVNNYMDGVRDTLNVPDGWGIVNDQQGIPAAFVPPPEKPEGPKAVVKKKKAKKKAKE